MMIQLFGPVSDEILQTFNRWPVEHRNIEEKRKRYKFTIEDA